MTKDTLDKQIDEIFDEFVEIILDHRLYPGQAEYQVERRRLRRELLELTGQTNKEDV